MHRCGRGCLVDTAPLKASLAEKAEAAVEALLSQLLRKSITMYKHMYGSAFSCVLPIHYMHAQVWTGLLLVDTAPLKASLAEKAEAAVEALLSQLLRKSITMYEHVCKRCEELSDEVLRPAGDTRGVLDLKVSVTCWFWM